MAKTIKKINNKINTLSHNFDVLLCKLADIIL